MMTTILFWLIMLALLAVFFFIWKWILKKGELSETAMNIYAVLLAIVTLVIFRFFIIIHILERLLNYKGGGK